MKRTKNATIHFAAAMLFTAGALAAVGAPAGDPAIKQVLADYTANTVIKTYAALADDAMILNKRVAALKDDLSDAGVAAAAEAWRATRAHWERSEAFLFGPASFNDLDPQLDSWPLDQQQVDFVISSIKGGKLEADAGYVRDYLGAALRGFHAVEYLLFRDGKPRKAGEVTPAELSYLVAVTQVMTEDCITLEAWWAGADKLSKEKAAVLDAAEIETSGAFGDEFKGAGEPGSRYASQSDAVHEMIQGCIDIADELGHAKIEGPFKSKNPQECESWYSWNSLADFQNNVRSIENAYLGGADGARGASLSALVAARDKDLDARVRAAITGALAKITAIGEPYRNRLENNDVAIQAAIGACDAMIGALEEVVKKFE